LESAAATELPALPLAVSSLSASSDGRHALAAALDGTVALVDVEKKEVVSKCETAREKVGDSASGELN
jgi:hypothetical protein